MSMQSQLPSSRSKGPSVASPILSRAKIALLIFACCLIILGIAAPFIGVSFFIDNSQCSTEFGCFTTLIDAYVYITLPSIILGTILAFIALKKLRNQINGLYWPGIISCSFGAISLTNTFFIKYIIHRINVHYVFFFSIGYYFAFFLPLVALSSSFLALYLADNTPWYRGKLLAQIAICCTILSLCICFTP